MQFQTYRWYLGIVYCFKVSMPLFPPLPNPAGMTAPSSPSTPAGGGRAEARRKGCTLAVEYSMHATWEGGLRNVYTDPWVRGPGHEALSREGSISPLAESRAPRQSLRAAHPRERGQLLLLPLLAQPKLEEVLSEERTGSQKPRSCQHPHP